MPSNTIANQGSLGNVLGSTTQCIPSGVSFIATNTSVLWLGSVDQTDQATIQSLTQISQGNWVASQTTPGSGGSGGTNYFTHNLGWIGSGIGGAGGGGSTACITEMIVEEEEYLNNQEYWDLARQRGINFRIRTARERERQAHEAEQLRQLHEESLRQRTEALARSKELLLEHLTTEQRKTFIENKWFIVIGGKTKTRYRIRDTGSKSHNIEVLSNRLMDRIGADKPVASLCCHLRDHDIPLYDTYLAQKVALMYDEDGFLKLANRHAA